MENLVIIGSGPAGLTAAVYAGRAELTPLVLTGLLPGGLLTQTSEIENFPGFPEGENGFELMFKMQTQAEKFGARMEMVQVEQVELGGAVKRIHCEGGTVIEARAVIISTGAQPRWLGLESEERLKNRGVSACAVCDAAFFRGKRVVVVGGGDSAMEEAIYLTNFAESVTVVHRRSELRASRIMGERAMANKKISFVWNSEVSEILGDTRVSGVALRDRATGEASQLECEGVFVALGHVPATALFAGQVELDAAGYVVLDGKSSRTNLPGVFAAGDCADPSYRQAVHAAGMGCRAALDAERYLSELSAN